MSTLIRCNTWGKDHSDDAEKALAQTQNESSPPNKNLHHTHEPLDLREYKLKIWFLIGLRAFQGNPPRSIHRWHSWAIRAPISPLDVHCYIHQVDQHRSARKCHPAEATRYPGPLWPREAIKLTWWDLLVQIARRMHYVSACTMSRRTCAPPMQTHEQKRDGHNMQRSAHAQTTTNSLTLQ